jgi:uncharacterized protein (DUF58 family)
MATPSSPSPLQALQRDASDVSAMLPPLLLQAEKLTATVMAGVHGRRRAGSGETFWQYRPYIQGDAATLIDWRQSARSSDRLYVRQQEWEIAATAWLWCDQSASLDYHYSDNLPTKRERMHVLATALCSLLTDAGERAGLLGVTERPLIGRRATELFARQLLVAQNRHDATANAEASLPPPMDGPGAKQAILFSDFYQPLNQLEYHFSVMAANRVTAHLVQIIDPSEEDYPFKGRTRFLPTQAGDSALLFGDAGALAKDYKDLFAAHHRALEDMCRHFGWTLTTHRTDHTAQSCLIALHQLLDHHRDKAGGQH